MSEPLPSSTGKLYLMPSRIITLDIFVESAIRNVLYCFNALTSFINVLHALENEGFKMKGLCKVTRTYNRWGKEEKTIYNGIMIRV